MTSQSRPKPGEFFIKAESIAAEISLHQQKQPDYLITKKLEGVLDQGAIEAELSRLHQMDVDTYIQTTVVPSENQRRRPAPEVIRSLGGRIIEEFTDGPFFSAEIEFRQNNRVRRLGFIAQNRRSGMGVWYPDHHLRAAEKVRFFASHGMPVVTFMDTPGAAADSQANMDNQSHAISFLISEMANLQVPIIGVVYGCGYSGGAIPLATANVLLCLKDGVFNTIHPRGLANIARKYNLSWEECAKYVGVSSYELHQKGYFDAIVDYSVEESHLIHNLRKAILSALESTEQNAIAFLRQNDSIFEEYRGSIANFVNPSEILIEDNHITDKTPTGILNIFGSVYRFLRYLKLRSRIESQTLLHYSRVSHYQLPEGKLTERRLRDRQQKFNKWLNTPFEVKYHEELMRKFRRFVETHNDKDLDRSRIVVFFIGDPHENYHNALHELVLSILIYLYNFWKEEAPENLIQLHEHLHSQESAPATDQPNPTLLEILQDPAVRECYSNNFYHMIMFDLLYNGVVNSLPMIAAELKDGNRIEQESVEKLFASAYEKAMAEFQRSSLQVDPSAVQEGFFLWLAGFVNHRNCDLIMRTISDWKIRAFPRLSPPLFGLVRYYFSTILPSLHAARKGDGRFQGKIRPHNIGIWDFWNRLDRAYRDLLIHNLLREFKRKSIAPREIVDRFFENFEERHKDLISSDPFKFPGFRESVEKALDKEVIPCGVITGLADFVTEHSRNRVGLVVSNTQFQAGAFDMASCHKVCALLVDCARERLPLIMFISSGGMQTKEGAGSLFSMPVMNDRITRFIKDNDLPVICFGFRDCMGGAQASFVTHRLVKTYYFSGTLMSFAGQLVVESHLPTTSILSNYLSTNDGAMDGLVYNPFDETIDAKLKEIDPSIPMAQITVQEVIARILAGEYRPPEPSEQPPEHFDEVPLRLQPIKRLLIHARGCTATRLIQAAHDAHKEVVLVQSDPDMESYPGQTLNENDRLVCIGGNTPKESYLNARSVVLVAEQEGADALHPGIGFLSETPDYAQFCREHGLNFIGPTVRNMTLMGNKSNAIEAASRCQVPVVPGSQGVVTDLVHGRMVAESIGFPVLVKAAHGGGGKGIKVIHEESEFDSVFEMMSQEALNAFGNGDLYLEKYITSMRHLEVQILRDSQGNCRIMGIRDCSVQRRYQKVIEESADDTLDPVIKQQLIDYSTTLLEEINYLGVGTVEFIHDLTADSLYFMEMNTRLQVEHPVTEMVTGEDLVQWQIKIAEGESIEAVQATPAGHAMELRITAEKLDVQSDGSLLFTPDPGTLTGVVFPFEEDIRVISAVKSGSTIPPFYDSLMAQVIAWGHTRTEVIDKLLNYIKRVRLNGVYSNLALLEAILKDQTFRDSQYNTTYLDGFLKQIDTAALQERMQAFYGSSAVKMDRSSILMEDTDEWKVFAPQTGAFYRSASPSDPPLVEEGEVLSITKPFCLLESMKIFNEVSLDSIKSSDGESLYTDHPSYTVHKVLAENGQIVSRGDLIMVITPIQEQSETQ